MALISSETLAKSAGDLYLAPYPTSAPTEDNLDDASALSSAGWVHAGWLHEDGPNLEGFEGENSKHYGWNAVVAMRSITRVTEPMIPVSLLQWNAENLSLYFPGATHDADTSVLTIPESGTPTDKALLLRIIDGDKHIGIWVAKVNARGGGAFEFPGDGVAPIPLVFDVLSTGTPATFLKVIGIDLASDGSS